MRTIGCTALKSGLAYAALAAIFFAGLVAQIGRAVAAVGPSADSMAVSTMIRAKGDGAQRARGQIATAGIGVWSTHGPGAPVSALAIDPVNPATVYALTFTGPSGVSRSLDGGESWNALTLPGPASYVGVFALAVDPADSNIIYLGSGDGVFKSTDFGATWSFKASTPDLVVRTLAIDPVNPNTIYADIFENITGETFASKSTDAGESWASVLDLTDLSVGPLAIDRANPSTVYQGTVGAIFKSTDGGASWNGFNADNGLPATFVNAVAIDPVNSDTIYAGTGDYCSGDATGIFESTDGGATWNGVGPANTIVDALALDRTQPNAIYAGIN